LLTAVDLVAISTRELTVICDVRINGQRDIGQAGELTMLTKPTKIQQRAFDLLGVNV
jgi:hypothetical protein